MGRIWKKQGKHVWERTLRMWLGHPAEGHGGAQRPPRRGQEQAGLWQQTRGSLRGHTGRHRGGCQILRHQSKHPSPFKKTLTWPLHLPALPANRDICTCGPIHLPVLQAQNSTHTPWVPLCLSVGTPEMEPQGLSRKTASSLREGRGDREARQSVADLTLPGYRDGGLETFKQNVSPAFRADPVFGSTSSVSQGPALSTAAHCRMASPVRPESTYPGSWL